MYNSREEYFDSFGPDKPEFKPETIQTVIHEIRELLLQGGDDGFDEDDLIATVKDWEHNDEFEGWGFVSIELKSTEEGIVGWYSREFAFDERIIRGELIVRVIPAVGLETIERALQKL